MSPTNYLQTLTYLLVYLEKCEGSTTETLLGHGGLPSLLGTRVRTGVPSNVAQKAQETKDPVLGPNPEQSTTVRDQKRHWRDLGNRDGTEGPTSEPLNL